MLNIFDLTDKEYNFLLSKQHEYAKNIYSEVNLYNINNTLNYPQICVTIINF